MKENKVQFIAVTAMAVALTYVFTAFVNVRLPIAANGGLIHLGNVLYLLWQFYSVRKQELSPVELEWDYLTCCQDGQRGRHLHLLS